MYSTVFQYFPFASVSKVSRDHPSLVFLGTTILCQSRQYTPVRNSEFGYYRRKFVSCAGSFKQSVGARNRVGIGLSYGQPDFIGWRNWFIGIDSWAPYKFKNSGFVFLGNLTVYNLLFSSRLMERGLYKAGTMNRMPWQWSPTGISPNEVTVILRPIFDTPSGRHVPCIKYPLDITPLTDVPWSWPAYRRCITCYS